ncbi:S-methyl-5-thioribose-1-phosphate isomerase [Pseudonocardia oroxyli]|uniref:Methylthioribose-1-phosphate isomerase n=1 Tax=Pseudonocardia oroxyli TaxID=366584 RepID=A0A1G7RVH9_PSEOR|nr:S-methyl-5-thioribose-1-phosphate isomerase [Pseudonocardia oroxyli]SDG13780.1 methylthioribose-1-phosphate isomerase [Pseudonocardia oroxyli]
MSSATDAPDATELPPTLRWRDDALVLLDQTRLPAIETLTVRTVAELVSAIRRLVVRGAPALGVAGAFGVVLARREGIDPEVIASARPTAVNLRRGVERAAAAADPLAEARAVLAEDVASCHAIGDRGAALLTELCGDRPLSLHTHCNAGALACVEWGTALGVVRSLHAAGRVSLVVADETRPLLQGSRITAVELAAIGVAHRVVVDGAAGSVIARGLVDAVVVGADRIAANGDVANKIGTYPLALAAARAGIPFVVAAPETTVDPGTASGAEIEIEERDPAEVVVGFDAWNPAFDVTPADLVTAIVTDTRVWRP